MIPAPSFTPYLITLVAVAICVAIFFMLPPDKPKRPGDC